MPEVGEAELDLLWEYSYVDFFEEMIGIVKEKEHFVKGIAEWREEYDAYNDPNILEEGYSETLRKLLSYAVKQDELVQKPFHSEDYLFLGTCRDQKRHGLCALIHGDGSI